MYEETRARLGRSKQNKDILLDNCLSKWDNDSLKFMFKAWKKSAQMSAHKKKSLGKCFMRWKTHKIKHLFEQWQLYATSGRRRRMGKKVTESR
jgi:hypothetical protein